MVQKQVIQVPFSMGIDTKTDPLQVPLGTLLELENGQFIHGGSISKRFGYDVLGDQTDQNKTITTGVSLATYNNQLLAFDGSNMYGYVDSSNTWTNIGPCVSTIVEDTQIIRTNLASQANPCSDTIKTQGGEVQCSVWEDTRGGIFYSVLDVESGSFLVNDTQITASGYAPKVIVFGTLFVVFYMNGNILNYQTINPYNPKLIGAPVELHTDGYASVTYGVYDVQVAGNNLFVGYINAAKVPCLYYLTPAYAMSAIRHCSSALTITQTNWCVSVASDPAENIYIHWADGYNVGGNIASYNLSALLISATGYIVESPGQVNNITALPVSSFPGNMFLFYEINNTNSQFQRIHIADITFDGSVQVGSEIPGSGLITTQRGVGLASKAFQQNGLVYINVSQASSLQATYFTMDQNRHIVAKISNEVGGGLTTNGMLPEVYQNGSVFTFANLIKGKIISQFGTLFTPLGVNSTSISFNAVNSFLNAELSQNLFIVGGVLQCFDGATITEAGFHIYPEGITAAAFSTGGGILPGSYQYVAIYANTDNIGQINYSADSVPITVDLTSSMTGTNSVVLTVPTLKLTSKQGVTILLYRTLANQDNFYRIGSFTGIANNPNVNTITYVDTQPDSAIQTNDLDYTTGGTLANIAPPACSIITVYNNRVFLAGLEDPNKIWYSKNKFDNTNANTVPVEFSDFLYVGVNSSGGPITAMAAMSGNLIIFKENNIYSLTGQGPDDTGANSDFNVPYLITTDTGCNNASSVVLMPEGLMFQSPKGIYLLDTSNTPKYIGQQVEAYNGYAVTGATLDVDSNQVIFTTNGGPALVYNYFFGQWNVWTNHLTSSQGSVSYGNNFTFIRPNGLVYVQNNQLYTDAGSAVSLKWQSAWMSLAQIQGYQMIYKILLLGQFKSPHTLNITIDYIRAGQYFTETKVITPTNTPVGYGTGNFGDGYFGGQLLPYQFRINPTYKKCTSIRITVWDNDQSPGYGEGYSISNMMLEVGVIGGPNRIPGQ